MDFLASLAPENESPSKKRPRSANADDAESKKRSKALNQQLHLQTLCTPASLSHQFLPSLSSNLPPGDLAPDVGYFCGRLATMGLVVRADTIFTFAQFCLRSETNICIKQITEPSSAFPSNDSIRHALLDTTVDILDRALQLSSQLGNSWYLNMEVSAELGHLSSFFVF